MAQIMFCLMSAVALVEVKIWPAHLKALEIRMRKLVLGLSLAQILPEKIKKKFYQKSLDSLMCCDCELYIEKYGIYCYLLES